MLLNFFTRHFHRRCPLCKHEVHEQGSNAVRRFGKWYCSEMHADRYELELYEALRATHCRHSGCHGEHVPLPEAMGIDCSPRQNPEVLGLEGTRDRCLTPLS